MGLERLLIGRTLDGRYAVEELIGRGRGGLVYRARHAQTGVEVALKVLAAPRTPEARERFRGMVAGEVRAAAAIEHPNVAGVYCLGHDAELGLDFVASELLRGQTLASVLSQRGKPPIALGLRLLSDAAEGMAAGHRAGLVHRDLRPASLYLVRGEGERQVRVKVAGFGVPQIVRRESLAGAEAEVSAYASPEMLAAGSFRLTSASDVFSLGVVGYELLTGHHPFDEAARRALAEGRAVVAEPPADVAASVPPQVVEAVLQALRSNPAERHADGAAFSAALQQQTRQVMVLGKITPASAQPAAAAPEPEPEPQTEAPAPAAPAVVAAAGGILAVESPDAVVVEIADLAGNEDDPAAPQLAAAASESSAVESPAPVDAPAAHAEPTPFEAGPSEASASPAVPIAAAAAEVVAQAAAADVVVQATVAPPTVTPQTVAPPLADLTRAPVPKPVPKRAGTAAPDLELYYPPKPPVFVPAAPSAMPAPQPVAAPVETPAPVAAESTPIEAAPAVSMPFAAAAPAAPPRIAETPSYAPVAPAAAKPAPTPMPGAARRRAAAAKSGGSRGPAMAAGFVLGLLVLGSAAWMAMRPQGDATASATTVPVASQLAQGPAAASAAPAQPAADARENTTPVPAPDTASRTARQRAADALKKQQDDERRRRDAETLRQTQLLQQQQAAQLARTAQAQPAPAPAQPQPQQVAVAPPPRPAPQPVAPPPAPAREEPSARAPTPNEVFGEDVVEERPRLTNVNELQRALQDRYPPQLQANRVSGSVMASFVVGADGRVDPRSIQIVNSPNPGFNAPTQTVLRRARFRPATVKGQPVRVQVTMPIAWTLAQ
ncbi:MAG TPA: TonB family protein [Longimicrobium sp.]|nr:TonB family protein [Longimicrobium sp.]